MLNKFNTLLELKSNAQIVKAINEGGGLKVSLFIANYRLRTTAFTNIHIKALQIDFIGYECGTQRHTGFTNFLYV